MEQSNIIDMNGNIVNIGDVKTERSSNTPLSNRTKGFKKLGKNELAKRLTTATNMLDKWMQGVIELGGRLLLVDPENEFFDSQSSNSTLRLMTQRSKELAIESDISTITYEFNSGREDVVVSVDNYRVSIREDLVNTNTNIKCETCNGQGAIDRPNHPGEMIVCENCHGLGVVEKSEKDV